MTDQSKPTVTLTDGSPVPADDSHKELLPSGQQRGYVVLSEEERAKGFVEPVRSSYVHVRCGAVTSMGRSLSETYARDPSFYGATFCVGCGTHFPVGAPPRGEFYWDGTNLPVGCRSDSTTLAHFDTSAWIARGRPDLEIQPALLPGHEPTYNRDLLYAPRTRGS